MIKSYCKINTFLRVIKKLNNGLHNIQANNMLLELHDTIRIEPILKKKDNIIFKGQFGKHVNKNKNSIIDTMNVLRKYHLIKEVKKYKIIINKRIPVFAGLGGGTSNSAFIIKYFLKGRMNNKLLYLFERKIGTDLRLFFFKNSFQKSLSNLKEFKKKFKFYFILIYPNIRCSTKDIYSKVKNYRSPVKFDPTKISSEKKYLKFIKNEKNCLQKIVENKHKKIKKVLDLIELQKDCYFSRMTGSGSTCYGMFKNKKKAMNALKIIRRKLPNFWCVITKTI